MWEVKERRWGRREKREKVATGRRLVDGNCSTYLTWKKPLSRDLSHYPLGLFGFSMRGESQQPLHVILQATLVVGV